MKDLMESVKRVCEKNSCSTCPLGNGGGGWCEVFGKFPERWDLEEIRRRLKNRF